MLGIATPKTDEDKAKMRAKLGRDHFFFAAPPTRVLVMTRERGHVLSLRWDFDQIDPVIKLAMVVDAMETRGLTETQADLFLHSTGAYFIEADLQLGTTESEPDLNASQPAVQRLTERAAAAALRG